MSATSGVRYCEAPQCYEKSRFIKSGSKFHSITATGMVGSVFGAFVTIQHVFHVNCFKMSVSGDRSFLESGLYSKCPTGRPDCACANAMAKKGEASTDPSPAETVNYAFNYYLNHNQFENAASLFSSSLLTAQNQKQAFHNGKFKHFIHKLHPELVCYISEKKQVVKDKEVKPSSSSSAPASDNKQEAFDEFTQPASEDFRSRIGRPRVITHVNMENHLDQASTIKDLQKMTLGIQTSLSFLKKNALRSLHNPV